MTRVIRFLLQFITTILTLAVISAILAGSLWYVYQQAKERSPGHPYAITAQKIERAFLGFYLRDKQEMISKPIDPQDHREITFVVEPGQSLLGIAYRLQEMNLIADAQVFRRYVQYMGYDEDIQAGAYILRRDMTMDQIMRQLQRGFLPTVTVTIPEGWRIEQIAQLLEKQGVTSAEAFREIAYANHDEWPFLADRPEWGAPGLEGFLFPDTYQLPLNTTPETVIEIMLRNFDWRVTEEMRAKAQERGVTLFEVVTLASIIEREAKVAEERPIIASVFWNRLNAGMPLQADPTVQYALGCDAKTGECWPQLTREQLNSVQSPYNTYLNPGLPPGPICNPGLDSIRAALEPAQTNYFYFLAREDGTHVFSETYEEHLQQDINRETP